MGPTLTAPQERRSRLLGWGLTGGAILYLVPFVRRGWIPHDEGLIGQSADWILRGGIPHVDYAETYTGGLSYLHAAVFYVAGVDLVHLRWVLLRVAAATLGLTYSLLLRYVSPLSAAAATWIAALSSFPNYFAALPSWWLLVSALASTWAAVRFIETDRRRYLFAAALFGGTAVTLKQTGLYLVAALGLFAFCHHPTISKSQLRPAWSKALVGTLAVLAAAMVALLLRSRLRAAEGLYLFLPALVGPAVLFVRAVRDEIRVNIQLVFVVGAGVAVPILALLSQYSSSHELSMFWYGAFVLPQRRLEFASARIGPAANLALGLIPIAAVIPWPASIFGRRSRPFEAMLWAAAVVLPTLALGSVRDYQLIWQSWRAFGTLVQVAIAVYLITSASRATKHDRMLFVIVAVLGWIGLNQYPYATPIYFCYTTPLIVVATVAFTRTAGCYRPYLLAPLGLMLAVFSLTSTNRGYVQSLGFAHVTRSFDVALNLPRAHLRVEEDDAKTYRDMTAVISAHLHGGQLAAAPDCPEIYFLTGTLNPTGAMFDFFTEDSGPRSLWTGRDVVVLNHRPEFSKAPGEALVQQLRREYPNGEAFDRFEVRWR